MKHLVIDLNKKLMAVHKKLLENERKTAEHTLGKDISPLEFFQMLTQSKDFAWLKPFSALILDIDELTEAKDELNQDDLNQIKKQVDSVLLAPESTLTIRYKYHLEHDKDFASMHANLENALKF